MLCSESSLPGSQNQIAVLDRRFCISDIWGNCFVPRGPPPNHNCRILFSITRNLGVAQGEEYLVLGKAYGHGYKFFMLNSNAGYQIAFKRALRTAALFVFSSQARNRSKARKRFCPSTHNLNISVYSSFFCSLTSISTGQLLIEIGNVRTRRYSQSLENL